MVAWGNTISMVINVTLLLAGIAYSFTLPSGERDNAVETLKADERGAVAGRIVSVPVKVYKQAFKATLSLGECPLIMKEGSIKTCKDKFEGEVVHLAKGGMIVDVSRIQSAEDVILHGMGGIGGSIGVLGIISLSAKINVAVTTETSRNALNLMSSYEVNRGVLALHHPRVKHIEGDSALYLSEIELGGNELLLVTLEFESEKQKVEVEISITFKILFITISAKLNYIHETFKSKASCRIQFKSSWREEINTYYSSLAACIPRVKEIEDMYMNGPKELRDMSTEDEKLHSVYYFSSWKASPYGSQFNLALINHDLEFLTEQNTEIKAVIHRINKLKDQSNFQSWPSNVRRQMIQLNETLTDKAQKLTSGLDEYHQLSLDDRQLLRDIYGHNKAPHYYHRYLNKIIAS